MIDRIRLTPLAAFVLTFCLLGTVFAPSASAAWWTEEAPSLARAQSMDALAVAHRTFRVDHDAFRAAAAGIPKAYTGEEGRIFELPTPDGQTARFRIVEDTVLSAELAAQRPDARFFTGVGIDDPYARVRMGIMDQGVHARVRSIHGSWTMDWAPETGPEIATAWWDRDGVRQHFACGVDEAFANEHEVHEMAGPFTLERRLGEALRTYRFAMNATGEFTQLAGSVANVEAIMMTLTNTMNTLYINEFSVRFELVGMNVYTDPGTDPFTNGTALNTALLNQSTSALNSVVGSSNYDVGHIISADQGNAQGGLAYVGVQCSFSFKGGGGTLMGSATSGSIYPIMIHEVGHQLGSRHSFNSEANGCGGGNRSASSAYEIGSGVTIMSYAGLCGAENVLGDDIDFFNAGSYLSIRSEIISSGSCGSTVTTGNSAPTAGAQPTVTIPRQTAFELTANVSDADGDDLTVSWEHFELGPASPPVDPNSGPAFRNFAPMDSPTRSFPEYNSYRRGAVTAWEFLPTVDRTMPFRFVVRDNNPAGGGTSIGSQTVVVSGAPFVVTGPSGGETFVGGTEVEVTWDVGGSLSTDVRILVSDDDARTWTEAVAATPNDGSAMVLLPCAASDEGRVRVEGIDNPFFDLNTAAFTITPEEAPPVITAPATFVIEVPDETPLLPDDPLLQPWKDAISADDVCDGPITPNLLLPANFPIGNTVVPITATDAVGNLGFATSTVILEVDDATDVPSSGRLETGLVSIAPNPFNPRTTIEFALERAQTASLTVFDVRGRRVDVLFEGAHAAGLHELTWNGTDADGAQVPSGVYFLRLVTEDGDFSRRAVLLK